LKLEASIQAVGLLARDDGEEAIPSQQAGALFVLANLGQLDLALALLNELWPEGRVSTEAATGVIDLALRSGEEGLQYDAARVLRANAGRLTMTDRGLLVPDSVGAWPLEWPALVRGQLISGLIDAIRYRPRSEWSMDDVGNLVWRFDEIRRVEPQRDTRAAAILALDALLEFEFWEDDTVLMTGREEPLSLAQLRLEIASLVPGSREEAAYSDVDLVDWLKTDWVDARPPPSTVPTSSPM
jgi:hypothetical protein